MIKTRQLEHIIKLALLSSYIKDERPVSLLIAARVESGKTELIRKANIGVGHGITYITDFTAWGIQTKYLDDIVKKKIRTILVPDFISVLSRSADTVETLIAFLNGLIEEGVAEIQTFAKSVTLKIPARCNIIAGIAKEHLHDQRHRWSKIGFLSRVIPVSFEYGPSSVYDIMQSIAKREYRDERCFNNFDLPEADVEVHLPDEVANMIAALAPQIIDAGKFAHSLYGFRLQKQLQTLCMANALFNSRTTVEEVDFEIIKRLGDFMNLKYRQI